LPKGFSLIVAKNAHTTMEPLDIHEVLREALSF
jgi:hypothetical protein